MISESGRYGQWFQLTIVQMLL